MMAGESMTIAIFIGDLFSFIFKNYKICRRTDLQRS